MYTKLLLSTLMSVSTLTLSYAQTSPIQKVEEGFYPQLIKTQASGQNIHQRMEARKVNGLSIAVIDKGELAWAKGYGLNDASQPQQKVDTTTLFQCASIGKMITAIAALQLVQANKITLDEDVNQKLSSWKIPENNFTAQKKVTLRMLLSHSAGLRDGYGFEGYEPHSPIPSLLQILNTQAPANNKKKIVVAEIPGSAEHYSGAGYLIIQQLIEDLSGTSFANYTQNMIFKPLGMLHSIYTAYPDSVNNLVIARGHEDNGKIDPKKKYHVYPEQGAAGPWTTPSDLAKLVIEVQKIQQGKSTKLLSQALVQQMLQPQINSMGLGFHLKGASEVLGFWHSGNNAGYTGVLFGLSNSGQGAIVLTNSNAGEWLAIEAIRSIATVYNWPIMQQLKPSSDLLAEQYVGTYALNGKEGLTIGLTKNQLYFQKKGNATKYNLYPSGSKTFTLAEKPDNISFVFEEQSGKMLLKVNENAGPAMVLLKM